MTPEEHDPQLTAEDEERVRRVLAASAPGPAAMPDEVAARLDDVLAQLVADRATGVDSDDAGGTDELARRRRARWPRLLVAAASVAVLALGSGIVLRAVTGSGGSADTTGAASTSSRSAERPSNPDALGAQGGPAGAPSAATPEAAKLRRLQVLVPLPRLHTVSLDADIRRASGRDVRRDAMSYSSGTSPSRTADGYACALPAPVRGGRLLAVRLDGERATLVLGPEHDGTRVARVYSCDNATSPVAETSVTTH